MNNRRTQILAGLAIVGLVAALVFAFGGGGGPAVVKPLRTASAAAASPAPAGDNPRLGYDAFRFFHTRNVFDPDRRPFRAVSNDAPPATPPSAHADFIALTGVLVREERSLAFFSGSRAEYNKVLSVRDRIAGAEITQISPAGIEIERAGQKTPVSVGQTVPLSNAASPGAAPAPETYAAAPSTTSAAAVGAPPPPPGSASPGAPSSSKQDDVRRRMEERRRQEQK